MKIKCWELKNGKEIPLLPTSTLDGFEWNAKYRLTVSNDDGSLGLPFLFATDDTAILTVETSEQDGMGTGDKKIKQVISCVPHSLGNEITCCRIRSHNGKEHVWSAWETMSSASGTKVEWDASSCVDTFITAGIYNISGDRLNVKDGLPIANSNPGHTINARLVVIDSSISGTGDTDDKCITQILALSNRTGGDGDVYIRTGRAQSTNMLAGGSGWEPWGKLQQNIEVGQVTSLNSFIGNGIYSGVYTNGSSFFETFVMVVINNYAVAGATGQVRSVSQFKYALNVDGTFSYKTRTGRGNTGIEWGSWVDLGAASTTDIQDNSITAQKLSSDVREKVEKVPSLEENAVKEKNALVNGDTIVGLAREVYSRQGKIDTATFLRRTTAGGTSICDGVASIMQIGGNIIKNMVDGVSYDNITTPGFIKDIDRGILTTKDTATQMVMWGSERIPYIANHYYYCRASIYNKNAKNVTVAIKADGTGITTSVANQWVNVSMRQLVTLSAPAIDYRPFVSVSYGTGTTVHIKDWTLIDLTEMYGVGKEPTKEECDRMFACMGAMPQGLTVAQPTGLKSIGFNLWNPDNVLNNKSIVENAIEDDVADRHIAVVECLPCKTGAGENNGYVIGYGEGDSWSEGDIEVYLTPLNPIDYIGQDVEYYMHKLDKDATYGTYVPQIKGYLLVVTPTTDKLCAHFHWSGDREVTDYEPYVESVVTLSEIPEMSEWGLAGVTNVNGVVTQDTIDLESNIYTRRIGKTDLGDLVWSMTAGGNFYAKVGAKGGTGIITDKYTVIGSRYDGELASEKCICSNLADISSILVRDSSYSDVASFKNAVKGSLLYYTLATPEEYAIIVRTAPNYIGSDYGVEEFSGSKVPLVANILFYMRSLVSETRNFLDRLMAGLGTSDATAVADKIIAAIASDETGSETTELKETVD